MGKFTKFVTVQDILLYLTKNPVWISAFTSGEGSFTGSFMIDKRAKWCIWPQSEFNLSQSSVDENLLNAINLFSKGVDGVYKRVKGVSSFSVRKMDGLRNEIIPFFNKYPLLGAKIYDFEKWVEIFELIDKKDYLKDTLEGRDSLILTKLQDLNARDTRNRDNKLLRNRMLIDWLMTLEKAPTLDQKMQLLALFKALKAAKKEQE
jgi:hypothetical protein